jgi:hypothetical protein
MYKMKFNPISKAISKAGAMLLMGAAFFQSSCSTDFDLNAPWKDISVVYAVLNQTDTVHYVKLNKAFLGEGNAFDYAAIGDSSIYNNEDGTMESWERTVSIRIEETQNNMLINTYNLSDTLINGREEGVFDYSGPQVMYYFVEPNLDAESEYNLYITINEGVSGEKEVRGETVLVRTINWTNNVNNLLFAMNLSYPNSSQINTYPSYNTTWNSSAGGKRYHLRWDFTFTEITTSGDTTYKVIPWDLGTVKSIGTDGDEPLTVTVNGEAFYEFVKSRVPIDMNIAKRMNPRINFYVTAAGDEMNTYMEVNEPTTGIVQEKPEYTNLENSIGIFSSRYVASVIGKKLNTSSMTELSAGQFTGLLGFCSNDITDINRPYYCP